MSSNFQNLVLDYSENSKKSWFSFIKSIDPNYALKLSPVLSILLTAVVFQSWNILFALAYIPIRFLISAISFSFDLRNLDLEFEEIIEDLEDCKG